MKNVNETKTGLLNQAETNKSLTASNTLALEGVTDETKRLFMRGSLFATIALIHWSCSKGGPTTPSDTGDTTDDSTDDDTTDDSTDTEEEAEEEVAPVFTLTAAIGDVPSQTGVANGAHSFNHTVTDPDSQITGVSVSPSNDALVSSMSASISGTTVTINYTVADDTQFGNYTLTINVSDGSTLTDGFSIVGANF